jgi:transcription initiation factor TFIIIB Brf1 subunit/transcription initiation factor TFIIB
MKKLPLQQCPKCKKKSFVVSVFGSVCGKCGYVPKEKSKFEQIKHVKYATRKTKFKY